MKKFFGLKMTLAALAVVSFASCYDSEGGDVIIPNATTTVWPAPVYVVNGVVTDYDAGNVMAGVKVAGAITEQTTDENGAFSATLTSPANGEVTFAKEGYLKATRTVKMATLSTGNAVYNVNVAMVALDSPHMAANIKEKDVQDPVDVAAEAITVADLVAWGYDEEQFTNTTTEAKTFDIWAAAVDNNLPYGVVAAASKADDGKQLFIDYVKKGFGNDPYVGYRIYDGLLTVTIPAQFKVTSFLVTPQKVAKTLVFPLADGDFEVAVESITDYKVEPKGTSLAHDHGHGHGDGNGAGGGANE